MAESKTYNKIVYDGKALIDLTADTVTAEHLIKGATAHDASGAIITGTCTYDADTSDATATIAEILAGKIAYVRGAKVTGTMPNRCAQKSVISSVNQTVTIQNGYHDGSGNVTIDSVEQAKIIASNIKQGVTILGVEGTCAPASGVKVQAKTVTPTVEGFTLLPDTGYDYLSQVKVNKIPYSESLNSAGGYTVTIG